jgi:signal transduction histidine kinase/CHASE3 domain sensor protein
VSALVGCTVAFTLSGRPAGHDSAEVLLAANRLERLVIDLERGDLGYVATGDSGTLSPWQAARAAVARQAATLQRLAAEDSPEQGRRAREIVRSAMEYVHGHAEPLMRTARQDRAVARSLLRRAEGPRRIDGIRHQFDRFADVQHRLVLEHERDALPTMRRMLATAAGASGSLLLIFLVIGYVKRGSHAHPPGVKPGGHGRRTRGDGLWEVATLVAREAAPAEVWDASAAEMGRALGAEQAMITRYDADDTATVVGHWSAPGVPRITLPPGGRWPVEDETVTDLVCRTGRPAHLRADVPAVGQIGAWIRANGIRQMIGYPIVADDRLWGMATVLTRGSAPWPGGAEETMREFAVLVGTAVAKARRHAELAASRVRLVEAADAARRRAERELQEKTQQRLVTVGLELRVVEAALPPSLDELRDKVSEAARDVAEITDDLQAVARELHPAFLGMGGLEASLRPLARRAGLPVELDVRPGDRPPASVAVTVYYVVCEALRNAAEHAHAPLVRITVELGDPVRLSVHDDGIGGARPFPGSALSTLRDRVEALGGVFEIDSPPGVGTSLRVTIPAGELPGRGRPDPRGHAPGL